MKDFASFTRRDFLKLSAAGALGLFLAESGLERALAAEAAPPRYGRILQNGLDLYESPSFFSPVHTAYGKIRSFPSLKSLRERAMATRITLPGIVLGMKDTPIQAGCSR
jgi:hypothetical protein